MSRLEEKEQRGKIWWHLQAPGLPATHLCHSDLNQAAPGRQAAIPPPPPNRRGEKKICNFLRKTVLCCPRGGGNVTLASARKPPRAGPAAGFLGRRQAKFSRCLSLPPPGIADHLSLHCPPSTLLIALSLERRASRWLHSRWGRAGHPCDSLNWIEVGVGEAGG